VIANAIAMQRTAVSFDRIIKQQPPKTLFDACRFFGREVQNRRTVVVIELAPAEEAGYIGKV
jgi:hypothetical protein